ncbi:MAG: hypothetical protein K8R76_08460, partial [Candidatus Aegiribacteria sp.]|nr:hypothetical protein [Candidatus Aegiribacteria sp.]
MRILIAGIVCLLASSLSAFDLIDTVQSLRQQVWESEYIPESTVTVVPITDYDEFEVIELFRAETIEELEASLIDGYPYPWLEETLKDESIPWEDRYWLDRRVRAAISQNLHLFFDTDNNPVYVDADAIFPGEYYWREYMIADLVGLSVPEGAERPAGFELTDLGYLYNPYGYMEGEYAFALPFISISRDGSIGAVSGLVSLDPDETFPVETFEFIMFPDGSYQQEFGLDSDREYDAVVSPDGSVAVFCCLGASTEDIAEENADTYIFDQNGDLLRSFTLPIRLHHHSWIPSISPDGHYVCQSGRDADACLIDCYNGTAEIVSERTEYFRNCSEYNFSPDGKYLCLGGAITGQMLNIEKDEVELYPETAPDDHSELPYSVISTSKKGVCVSLATLHETQSGNFIELNVIIKENRICNETLPSRGFTAADVSPNGYYLLVNPVNAAYGYPTAFGSPDVFNLPMFVMQIEGR